MAEHEQLHPAEMSEQTTPETGAAWLYPVSFDSNEKVVHISVAQQLERERDEAQNKLDAVRKSHDIVTTHFREAERERDEAREERDIARLQRDEAVADHQRAFKELEESKNEIDQYFKERGEAREFAEQWYFLHDQQVRSNIEIEKKLDEAMNVLETIASWQGGLGAKWPQEIARDFLARSTKEAAK